MNRAQKLLCIALLFCEITSWTMYYTKAGLAKAQQRRIRAQRALKAASISAQPVDQNEPKTMPLPKILADKSIYVQGMIEGSTVPINLDQFPLIPNTTQKTVNQLAQIYEYKDKAEKTSTTDLLKKQSIQELTDFLKQRSIKELIDLVNLETFLEVQHNDKKLSEQLAIKLVESQEGQLIIPKHLMNLNLDKTAEITEFIIKETKIDAHLLKPYNDWLAKHPQTIENNTVDPRAAYEDLLFFNDQIKIYGIIWSIMNEPASYDTIVIKKNNQSFEIQLPNF